MKKLLGRVFLATFLLLVVLLEVVPAQQKAEEGAQSAAKAWLALVDSGKYVQSWREAAQSFKAAVPQDRWERMISATRAPLGAVQSRKPISARYTTTLPGAPDGEYVVIQYDSSFQHKKAAVETITPMLDKDGHWRVSGYYIK